MATYGFCRQIFQRSFLRLRTTFFSKSTRPCLKPVRAKRVLRSVPPVAAIPVLSAWSLLTPKTEESKVSVAAAKSPEQIIIESADQLYEEGKVEELFEYLSPYKNTGDANILWRICRAMHDKAKGLEKEHEKKPLMYDAFSLIQKALAIDDCNFAVHKWMGIMLKVTGSYEGSKQLIANSYKIKEHFMKAVELNPKDATSIYLLGSWCFEVADLPWVQRQVASVIFATPPTSSYEEALGYFLDAEKAEPNFYNMNLVMLGRTYLKLNKKADAKIYFQRAIDYPIKSADDQNIHDEANMHMKCM